MLGKGVVEMLNRTIKEPFSALDINFSFSRSLGPSKRTIYEKGANELERDKNTINYLRKNISLVDFKPSFLTEKAISTFP